MVVALPCACTVLMPPALLLCDLTALYRNGYCTHTNTNVFSAPTTLVGFFRCACSQTKLITGYDAVSLTLSDVDSLKQDSGAARPSVV